MFPACILLMMYLTNFYKLIHNSKVKRKPDLWKDWGETWRSHHWYKEGWTKNQEKIQKNREVSLGEAWVSASRWIQRWSIVSGTCKDHYLQAYLQKSGWTFYSLDLRRREDVSDPRRWLLADPKQNSFLLHTCLFSLFVVWLSKFFWLEELVCKFKAC